MRHAYRAPVNSGDLPQIVLCVATFAEPWYWKVIHKDPKEGI